MALTSKSKGKKRALEESQINTNSGVATDQVYKKSKRAETRKCPICDEAIPLRLLGRHAELEAQRVDEIIRQIGSTEGILDDVEEGPSSRKSAKKARKSFTAVLHPRSTKNTLEHTDKTLQGIKRRRKQRHSTLREMTREDEEGPSDQAGSSHITGGGEMVCPVCTVTVRGDQDVLEAHVDACLANESVRQRQQSEQETALRRVQRQQQQQVEQWEEYTDIDGAGGHVGNVRGTGFHTRNRNEQDVDDDIDIDGEDQTFGDTQFTEGDILGPTPEDIVGEDLQVEIDGDEEDEAQLAQKTLRDLIAVGVKPKLTENGTAREPASEVLTVEEIDLEIQMARQKGSRPKLIAALERKVDFLQSTPASTSLQCRICLDPYDEPTVSTGCWHTCCRECWLRCLGSTKLCPICKRITGASDLRKIYL